MYISNASLKPHLNSHTNNLDCFFSLNFIHMKNIYILFEKKKLSVVLVHVLFKMKLTIQNKTPRNHIKQCCKIQGCLSLNFTIKFKTNY